MVKLIIGHYLYMKSNWYGVCFFDTGNMIYMDLTRILYRYSLGTICTFSPFYSIFYHLQTKLVSSSNRMENNASLFNTFFHLG